MNRETSLPERAIDFEIARIERGRKRLCKCTAPHFELDPKNRIVICKDCSALWDPFNALLELTEHYERIASFEERVLEQRKQILAYKPRLAELKEFEKIYGDTCKRGTMVPVCPRCGEAFELKELNHFTNRMHLVSRKNDREPNGELY